MLNNLGAVELDLGHGPTAIAHFESSLERFTELNDQWGVALVLCNLAHAMRTTSKHARAEQTARRSVREFEALGDAQGTARSLTTLGLILGRSGRITEGLQLLARAADLRMQANDRAGLARSLENIAWCQAKLGDASAAAWLLGQAESLREAVDVPLSADDHVEYDETVTRLRSALDADERAALRTAGRAAPLTEALFRVHVQFQPDVPDHDIR